MITIIVKVNALFALCCPVLSYRIVSWRTVPHRILSQSSSYRVRAGADLKTASKLYSSPLESLLGPALIRMDVGNMSQSAEQTRWSVSCSNGGH